MRVCERFVRALMVVAVCCVAAGFASGQAAAPAVTVSPSSLIFAVPGTVSTASASQEITVSIAGGSVPVSISIGGMNASDFTETDTCGTNPAGTTTIAPPGCVIDVTFTPTAGVGAKEVATLTVNAGASTAVNLSGSLGAILLFKPVNIGTSNGNVSLSSLVTFNSTTLALSCPAGSTETLSSSPDGGGFVMVDNFLTVQLGSNLPPQTNASNLGGTNVCPGGLGNPSDAGQPDCFTTNYQGAATGAAFGKNPDTFANPNNTVLPGPGGVPPITITSNFANGGTTPMVTFNMLDGGGEVGSTSLFLVTQCTPQGVAPGGTVTGNPVNPQDPSTLSQAAIFDSTNGQNISITTDVTNSPNSVTPGTQQVTTDFAIPQSLFNQLVAGTSAAPAVCLRLNGERDTKGNAMCKGYLIQCWDPGHHTLTGDNCITTPSLARNLLDATKFDSPDAPPGQNYLTAPANDPTHGIVSACAGVATGCALDVIDPDPTKTVLVGPGILLGGDQWLCTPTSGSPPSVTCTNQQLDTLTPAGSNYTAANCVLTGTLANDLCPLDTLTQFKGAADPVHGSTTTGKNSIFVPVVNVPLPFTQTTVTGRNANGWVNTPSVTATFISNQANYKPTSANPGGNNFVPAPPYSVTYGFAPATSPAPDTTFPVSGDSILYNSQTKPGFGAPLCTIGANGTPGSFTTPPVPYTAATVPGTYNLHYFTTDCALTDELLFQPTAGQLTDASANWASFRTIAFGVDTSAPSLTCGAPTPNGTNGWYKSAPTVGCSATDDYSGFTAPTLTVIPNPGCDPAANPDCAVNKGPLTLNFNATSSGTGAATQFPVQSVQDLAGNASNTQGPYLTPIDNTVPTISAKFNVSGTAFSVGQSVNVTLTCKDVGSGVGTCGGQPVACPVAPAMGSATFTVTALPIDTTAGAIGPHTLNAVDCAGNVSGSINYTVAFGSAELVIATLPNPVTVKNGSNLTYKTFVLNIGPNAASNVVVTDTLPANTTYVSAISGVVSCTLSGCNDLATGSSCSLSANVVTCSTPTIKPILSGLSGFVIKLVVKVSVPKGTTSVTDIATVTSSNPDPIKGDNTATVSTKVTQ